MLVVSILLLALSRAEIIARMRAPVVTQAQGLIQVFADCPEDLRREYQMPVASFADETVKTLYRSEDLKGGRFARPGIVIHLGEVRTNLATVVTRVATNDGGVVTRLYVPSPGYADLERLRLEVVKGFARSVLAQELSDTEARQRFRRGVPALRIQDEREALERWLRGEGGMDDEAGLREMRKIIEPGFASRRDILIFASRLFLYLPSCEQRFVGKYQSLSFKEAIGFAKIDPRVRLMAILKANEMPVLGGGRGEALTAAALAYEKFLRALSLSETSEAELRTLLEDADIKLNLAFEKAKR